MAGIVAVGAPGNIGGQGETLDQAFMRLTERLGTEE